MSEVLKKGFLAFLGLLLLLFFLALGAASLESDTETGDDSPPPARPRVESPPASGAPKPPKAPERDSTPAPGVQATRPSASVADLRKALLQPVSPSDSDLPLTERFRLIEANMEAVEKLMFGTLHGAVEGSDVAAALKENMESLKELARLLEDPQGVAMRKAIADTGTELRDMRRDFESKTRGGKEQATVYLGYIEELIPLEHHLEKLETRIGRIQDKIQRLANSATDLVGLYEDARRFKGEVAAKRAVLEHLEEIEKTWIEAESQESREAEASAPGPQPEAARDTPPKTPAIDPRIQSSINQFIYAHLPREDPRVPSMTLWADYASQIDFRGQPKVSREAVEAYFRQFQRFQKTAASPPRIEPLSDGRFLVRILCDVQHDKGGGQAPVSRVESVYGVQPKEVLRDGTKTWEIFSQEERSPVSQ